MSANLKATNDQILTAYAELSSVKKVGDRFGMCGQSVHERLVKLGAINHVRRFSDLEKSRLIQDYNRLAAEGRSHEIAEEFGRTRQYISRQANKLGLTTRDRKRPYISEAMSISKKAWHKANDHPKGMLGKTHSNKFKNDQSERGFVRWHSMGKADQIRITSKSHRSWKAGWRLVGGKRNYYRSRWEANYARYLQWLLDHGEIKSWEHEPRVFWFLEIKRGTRSYLPDFRVTENSGSVDYHEVKGWMDSASRTKIKRMAKYYPEIKLLVIDSRKYKAIEKIVCRIISGWETAA